jgi:gamma-glutamyltranspeptidase/glutathione hydrolase
MNRAQSVLASLAFAFALGFGCTPATEPVVASAPSSSVSIAAPAPPKFPQGWPHGPGEGAVTGANGMVSTDQELGSKVGTEILASGGNAVDAAIATAFALAVVHPAAGNLGGGGFMVARIDGKAYALDFRETAPGAATTDMYVVGGKATHGSRTGHVASGVPGSVAGLWEAHQKLGSKGKSWADLIAPAIKLAEEGFLVPKPLAETLTDSWIVDRMRANAAAAAIFYPGGAALTPGTRFKQPDLAVTLRRIADKGPAGFYEGPTAELIAAEMKRGGGIITMDDLRAYRAKWRDPIEFSYRGQKIVSMPPPSSGGVTLAMICHIVEGFDLAKLGWHSPSELHYVFESMRRAYIARNEKLGDPDFVKMPVDELMSDAWAKAQRATIKQDKATPSIELRPEGAGSGGNGPHTTHFSVVDAKGNAVALTTTLNWWFGNGVVIPGAGFLMNNQMDDFAVKVGTANSYGLVQGEPNAIAPGKRMLSSMTPTIVTAPDGSVRLVVGAAGGSTITTTVFHILSNVVDFGFDVATAVNAPRYHMQDFPDVVVYEEKGIDQDLRRALEAMGYTTKERGHIADAPSIGRGSGGWIGAREPRRSGGGAAGW